MEMKKKKKKKKKVHMFTQLHVLNWLVRIFSVALRECKIRTLWTPGYVDN